jgi:parallel beta-helix repeat protein
MDAFNRGDFLAVAGSTMGASTLAGPQMRRPGGSSRHAAAMGAAGLPWYDPMAYGAQGNGTTDDTTAIKAAIAAIPSTGGTLFIGYPFGISGTINVAPNVQVLVTNGGQFVALSTAQLNFNEQITADPYQIFGSISNLTVRFNVGVTVLPEWWGAQGNAGVGVSGVTFGSVSAAHDDSAAIQGAINSLLAGGAVRFAPKNYAIGTMLTVGPIVNVMSGWSIALVGAGKNMTNLAVKNANQAAVEILGTQALGQVKYVSLSGFGIFQVVSPGTGGVGVTSVYSQGTTLSDLQINGFMIGVNLLSSQNANVSRVTVGSTAAVAGFIGFDIDGAPLYGSGYGNNSSVLRDCTVDASIGDKAAGIGFKVFSSSGGGNCADLLFDNCSTASTAYAWKMDFSNVLANTVRDADVQLVNPICDLYALYGVYVTGNQDTNQSVTILGGWFNPSTSPGGSPCGVAVIRSRGVTVSGGQFAPMMSSAQAAFGIYVLGSPHVVVSGCLFNGTDYGVYLTSSGASGSDYCSINGNRFFSSYSSVGKKMLNAVAVYSSAGVSVNNNVFDAASSGGMGTALYFDSTATKCIATSNTANAANIASSPPMINSSTTSVLSSANNLW